MKIKDSCKKKEYLTIELAKDAAKKINQEGAKKDGKNVKMRAYKCENCCFYHLTTMSKNLHKFINDVEYRTKVKEKKFIERESDYWNRKFGIMD
jgi:hypothetical protein